MVPAKMGISSPLFRLRPLLCAHESTQYMLPPLLLLLRYKSFWKAQEPVKETNRKWVSGFCCSLQLSYSV